MLIFTWFSYAYFYSYDTFSISKDRAALVYSSLSVCSRPRRRKIDYTTAANASEVSVDRNPRPTWWAANGRFLSYVADREWYLPSNELWRLFSFAVLFGPDSFFPTGYNRDK